MALPPQYQTPEMEKINKSIEAMSPHEFSALPPLNSGDHQLIGIYIQLYNSIDFNLRRAIEIFGLAKLLPDQLAKKYSKLHDSELASTAARVVEKMDPNIEDVAFSLDRLKEIDLGRPYRNLFGHFAAKRFPKNDVFVFCSKDERDSERVHGRGLSKTGILIAVAPIKNLRELAQHMVGTGDWIAYRIPVWFDRYQIDRPY